jgi:lycopene beta-cyclase
VCNAYHSIRAEDFFHKLYSLESLAIKSQAAVENFDTTCIRLATGESIRAQCVLDARGWLPDERPCGFQKFIGLNVKTVRPHGLQSPILMDARVSQAAGYHFVYVLPWAADELLIEDTYYNLDRQIYVNDLETQIREYARSLNIEIACVLGRESGCLPIPLRRGKQVRRKLAIGAAGGFINPTTGYTFYGAAMVAEVLSSLDVFEPNSVDAALAAANHRFTKDRNFFLRLNNMLFLGARPSQRARIFKQFYGRDPKLITRFYAGFLKPLDKLRLVWGVPPIPIHKGLFQFFSNARKNHGHAV